MTSLQRTQAQRLFPTPRGTSALCRWSSTIRCTGVNDVRAQASQAACRTEGPGEGLSFCFQAIDLAAVRRNKRAPAAGGQRTILLSLHRCSSSSTRMRTPSWTAQTSFAGRHRLCAPAPVRLPAVRVRGRPAFRRRQHPTAAASRSASPPRPWVMSVSASRLPWCLRGAWP